MRYNAYLGLGLLYIAAEQTGALSLFEGKLSGELPGNRDVDCRLPQSGSDRGKSAGSLSFFTALAPLTGPLFKGQGGHGTGRLSMERWSQMMGQRS